MGIVSNPANYLVSAQQVSGNGSALDTRAALALMYYHYATYAASALYTVQASFDLTAWMPVMTVTATTTTATGGSTAYLPYVRAQVNSIWSGAGGTGSGIFAVHPLV